MADISREEALRVLDEMQFTIGTIDVEYWSDKGKEVDAVRKAISDMEKLQKIEQILTSMEYTDDEVIESFAFRQIEQIVKGEEK